MKITQRERERIERDVRILHDIYNHRAMTTSQLASRHNYSMRHMYRLMRGFRSDKFIFTGSVRGYTTNRSRQADYHRISKKGIRFLNDNGIKTELKPEDLRISSNYLPYALSLNDLSIQLSPHGWEVTDSREVKRLHDLGYNERIDGMLTSPLGNKSYIYIFISPYSPMNLRQVKGEVERNSNFQNILMLAKSGRAFEQIINEFNSFSYVVQYQSFRVLPFDYGCRYLPVFDSDSNEVLYDYLSSYGVDVLLTEERQQSGLSVIVEHEGKQKYLVNMLDNDLTHLHSIMNYRHDRYKRDGRKVLLVTNLGAVYKQLLSDVHHVDFLDIPTEDLNSFMVDELSRKQPVL